MSPPEAINALATDVWKRAIDGSLDAAGFDRLVAPRLSALTTPVENRNDPQARVKHVRWSRLDALVTLAHEFYLGLLLERQPNLPLDPSVRIIELTGHIVEQAGLLARRFPESAPQQRHLARLLGGLALYAIARIERVDLDHECTGTSLSGMTERFERALMAALSAKAVADDRGMAPWLRALAPRLESRIEDAVANLANAMTDHILRHGKHLGVEACAAMLDEQEHFMRRFGSDLRAVGSRGSPAPSIDDPTPDAPPQPVEDRVVEVKRQGEHVVIKFVSGRFVTLDTDTIARCNELSKSANVAPGRKD